MNQRGLPREEVRILKELQGEKRLLFTDEQRSRLARKAKRIRCSRLKEIANVVTPQTLLAWHRKLIAKIYDSSANRRGVGRPSTAEEIRDLVIKMAEENRGRGYTRIRGALANLGHEIGRGTITEILKQAGMNYHGGERDHQGLENSIIQRDFKSAGEGEVNCHERLGGLLRYYHRDARKMKILGRRTGALISVWTLRQTDEI